MMEGLLFPIVMLTVTLVGGRYFSFGAEAPEAQTPEQRGKRRNPHGTGIYQCPGCKGQVSLH